MQNNVEERPEGKKKTIELDDNPFVSKKKSSRPQRFGTYARNHMHACMQQEDTKPSREESKDTRPRE
jgi:hypothetical protein